MYENQNRFLVTKMQHLIELVTKLHTRHKNTHNSIRKPQLIRIEIYCLLAFKSVEENTAEGLLQLESIPLQNQPFTWSQTVECAII